MLQKKPTLLQTISLEKIDIKDKGKAPMEVTNEKQLLKNFENIMININEYYEVVDEKIELIEEMVPDISFELEKVREISIHFFRIELKEHFSKQDPKKVQN